MSQWNEVIKNFLFAASLRPDDELVSKVVSAKRLLYINLGTEIDRYPYSNAVIAEITCKDLLIAVDRQRLVQASAASQVSSANQKSKPMNNPQVNGKGSQKSYNPKEYVQRLYSFRSVLKKTMTTDKLFTLLHHSHHVLPPALVENTQQSLSSLFEALDKKAAASQSTSSANATARRTDDEETIFSSLSRAEYFCAGIFCEAKRRPELASLLKLEPLIELAEVQVDAFRNATKILSPVLQTYVYTESSSASNTTGTTKAARTDTNKHPPPPSNKTASIQKVKADEVLDFDEDDQNSYAIMAVAIDIDDEESTTTGTKTTISSKSASIPTHTNGVQQQPNTSSTLGKRNLQAFLQTDRRRHLAELAFQQSTAASSSNKDAVVTTKQEEELKRQRQLVETQRFRILYEIWRDQILSSTALQST